MTTTSVSDPLVGHALADRYEITRRLARGGMATVYLAHDLRLTRTVAVKVMHIGLGDDADFTRKFDREARAAARLSHPNVVSVFDQGIDAGRPFIVMEYVHGRTLRSMMRHEGAMDLVRALTVMEAVLCALAAAHEAGLVHRDIKPENVLISDRHQVKVADFGLAKAITAQTSTATAGLLIGTVSYLPPELVTSGRADTRSDVYSAGIVLYELLTGRKPHTGDSPIQVAYAHVHNDVGAPSAIVPEIPNFLDALVQTATARDPRQRPSDARIMLQQLRSARERLRAGVQTDDQLTEVISSATQIDPLQTRPGSVPPAPELSSALDRPRAPDHPLGLDQWSQRSGIPVRSAVMPAGYDPRTQLSPASPPAHTDPNPVRPGPWAVSRGHRAAPTVRSRASAPATRPRTVLTPRSGSTPVEPARAPRQDLHRARRRGVIALVLVLALAATAAYAGWWTVAGRSVATPTLTNLTEAEAIAAAEEVNLHAAIIDRAHSETVATGRVLATDPAPGEGLVVGGTIALTLSLGPERFAVPDVVGSTLEGARTALAEAQLRAGKVSGKWNATAAKGTVTAMSTPPGTEVRRDSVVDLTISKGPQPIPIPSYRGRSGTEAEKALTEAGFTVTVERAHSDSVAEGVVIEQSPHGGEGVRGDRITVTVSLGLPMVKVPEVRARRLDDAAKALSDVGFRVERKPVAGRNALGLGVVSYTDPEAGTEIRKGSTVTLFYV